MSAVEKTRKPRAFRTPQAFREWLAKNHASETELYVRLYKVHAADKGIGYKQALDEALCWGWIDGVVRRLDEDSFQQRFTPRRPKSNWSAVNIKRMGELMAEGRVAPPGLKAFEARDKVAVAPYSFENRNMKFSPAFMKRLKADAKAWAEWEKRPPGQRRNAAFWVMSAKKDETRDRRFGVLLEKLRSGEPVGVM